MMRCRRGPLLLCFLLALAGPAIGCANPRGTPSEAPATGGPDPARAGGAPGTSGVGGGAGAAVGEGGGNGQADGAVGAGPDAPGDADPAASGTCPVGTHECAGTCADDRSPLTCNRSCSPCQIPMGGSASCDGVKCNAVCPAGQKPCADRCIGLNDPCDNKCMAGKNLCNQLCVDATDLSACGSACTPCPASAHGKSSCDGDKCSLTCDAGYHACDNTCAKNDDPKTCGTSCTPCEAPTGGKATCDGTTCKSECPSGTFLCMGACLENGRACGGVCPGGKHDCGGNCVSNDNPNNCGPNSCTACKPPANANATCNASTCGFTCKSGYHLCNGSDCRDDKSTSSCGGSCSPCPVPAGGKATCRNGVCDFDCASGRRCHDACVGDNQPCDGACPGGTTLCRGSCVAPASLSAEICDGKDNDCDGGIDNGLTPPPCSPACAGTQKCAGGSGWSSASCAKTDSDPNNCGGNCEKCKAAGGGTPVCRNGTCDFDCRSPQKKCLASSGQASLDGCYECCSADQCGDMPNSEKRCTGNRCQYTCSGMQCGGTGTCYPLQGACIAIQTPIPACMAGICVPVNNVCPSSTKQVRYPERPLSSGALPKDVGPLKAACQGRFPGMQSQLCSGLPSGAPIAFYVDTNDARGMKSGGEFIGTATCP